jgi:hypothetical protein
MDVGAWRALENRGLAHLTGVRPVAEVVHDASEVFTDHPINGRYAGRQRDCRQSFWPEPAYCLESGEERVEELSFLADYSGRELGACLTAYENELGGRVVVAGYYPWFLLHNESKSAQVKNVCTWLSRDTLPVVVETYAKAIVWARGEPDGKVSLLVLNASLDPVHSLELRVGSAVDAYDCLSIDGDSSRLFAMPLDQVGPYARRRVKLDTLAPWGIVLLTPASHS